MDDSNTIITAFLIFLIFLVFSLDGVFTLGGRNNRIIVLQGRTPIVSTLQATYWDGVTRPWSWITATGVT